MSPIALGILLSTPFWCLVGYVINGWLGVGWVLIAAGLAEIALASVPRPPHLRVIEEQRIGAFDRRGRLRLSRAEQRRMAA